MSLSRIIMRLARNPGTEFAGGDDHRGYALTAPLTEDARVVQQMLPEIGTDLMPVMDNRVLMGVISFYDVAKAVVDSQNFENRMLKAYIRDWPAGEEEGGKAEPNFP